MKNICITEFDKIQEERRKKFMKNKVEFKKKKWLYRVLVVLIVVLIMVLVLVKFFVESNKGWRI